MEQFINTLIDFVVVMGIVSVVMLPIFGIFCLLEKYLENNKKFEKFINDLFN